MKGEGDKGGEVDKHSPETSFAEEKSLLAQGYRLIAGIDEVGRGALVGPVVAAAVILPQQHKGSLAEQGKGQQAVNSGDT